LFLRIEEAIVHAKSLGRKTYRRSRTGTTTVEFAFVVPIIFVLFIGAVELTRVNFLRHSAANASYEGARKAIVPGAANSEAQTAAMNLLTSLGVANGAVVTVTSDTSRVTVNVVIPVNQNSWGLSRFSSGINVSNTCSLSREVL
jgi:Flp pilus assembly protein TadG